MTWHWIGLAAAAALVGACATSERPATAVDGVRKVIESLTDDIAQRQASEPFRNLPVASTLPAAQAPE